MEKPPAPFPVRATFKSEPVYVMCPQCLVPVKTVVTVGKGRWAWVGCCLMCLACCCCCSCIPFCIDRLKAYTHRCPRCEIFIAGYEGKRVEESRYQLNDINRLNL